MSGEKNLATLLSNMDPVLDDTEYVYVSFPEGEYGGGRHLRPVGMFLEEEGMTLIIPRESAEKNNMAFDTLLRRITLQVHSSLEAVGLTAAISQKLTENNISANVVAAFYHDHVFVPATESERALAVLSQSWQ